MERGLRLIKLLLEYLKDYSPRLLLIEEGRKRRVAILLEGLEKENAIALLQSSVDERSLSTSRNVYVYEIVMGEMR